MRKLDSAVRQAWLECKTMGIKPAQNPWELQELLELIRQKPGKSQVALEIGSRFGGWMVMVKRLCPNVARFISVDVVPLPHVAKRELAGICNQVVGDSTAPGTISDVGRVLHNLDRNVDILHIDGNHEYEYAKGDFGNYLPFMEPDGMVIFHDTLSTKFGVGRFFDEIKNSYRNQMIVGQPGEGKLSGIGIIWLGEVSCST